MKKTIIVNINETDNKTDIYNSIYRRRNRKICKIFTIDTEQSIDTCTDDMYVLFWLLASPKFLYLRLKS